MAEAFPLVEVSGAPVERGRQHGRQARERVAKSVALYADWLKAQAFAWDHVRRVVDELSPSMAAFSPAHVEEMRGIAEGAGQEYAAIALINARTEIMQIAKRRADRGGEGCTTAIVLPERSASGRLLHVQNWDWRAACAETGIVLRVRREDGPDVLTFTEAGGLARHGFNSLGLCVTGNYLRSDRDLGRIGVPLPLIRRLALECEHAETSIGLIAGTPRSVSNNMAISRANGFALDFECAPDESFIVEPHDGLLIHANHWESPVALAKLKDTGLAGGADTLFRAWRVRALLGREGRLSVDQLKAAFLDDMDTPHAVCQPPHEWDKGDVGATVATLVMDPGAGTLDAAPMPALGARFTRYALAVESSARSAAD
jgi:isopenicillin-N N-acyltransferase-like protein